MQAFFRISIELDSGARVRVHLEISKKTEPFLALPLRTDFDYFSIPQIEYPLGLDIGKSSWIRLIVEARMLNFY